MTWKEAIDHASGALESAMIMDAKINAEYLAAFILGLWNKGEVRTHADSVLTGKQAAQFETLVGRRKSGEPLQHIIGETEFFGLRIFTSPAALIPRPDTEILVEETLNEASKYSQKKLRILDIGTGSGAIALALAAKLPYAQITGIDISLEALEIAKKNQERLKIQNVVFEQGDVFDLNAMHNFQTSTDILVSNPPYISSEEYKTLHREVRNFEPRIALTDESDGLTYYRRIAEIAPDILNVGGKVIIELGFNGALKVEEIFTGFGWKAMRIVKDLQGILRVMVIGK